MTLSLLHVVFGGLRPADHPPCFVLQLVILLLSLCLHMEGITKIWTVQGLAIACFFFSLAGMGQIIEHIRHFCLEFHAALGSSITKLFP